MRSNNCRLSNTNGKEIIQFLFDRFFQIERVSVTSSGQISIIILFFLIKLELNDINFCSDI